jgi:anti-sigma factor RsiW
MKECWSEGALRAYLDRELPPEDTSLVAAHLEVCSECGDLWTELAGRAGRVSALMNALPAPDRTISISRAPRPAKTARWRWAGAGAAVAAGLLLGVLALPKRQAPPLTGVLPVQAPAVLPVPDNIVPAPDPVEPRTPAVMNAVARPGRVRPVRQGGRGSPKTASDDGFVALDDEPLDIGVVLRVALGPKGVPADVIFGSDGRPHAIRLVNDKSKH